MLPVIKDKTKTGTIKNFISGKWNKYFDKKACDKLLVKAPAKLIPKNEKVFLKTRINFIIITETIPPHNPK